MHTFPKMLLQPDSLSTLQTLTSRQNLPDINPTIARSDPSCVKACRPCYIYVQQTVSYNKNYILIVPTSYFVHYILWTGLHTYFWLHAVLPVVVGLRCMGGAAAPVGRVLLDGREGIDIMELHFGRNFFSLILRASLHKETNEYYVQ
jgi:hypothetical protein